MPNAMHSLESQPEQEAGAPRAKGPGERPGRIVIEPGVPRPLFSTKKQKRSKRDRHSRRKVAFFHFSYYEPAFKYFTEQVLDADFITLPPATRRTINIGAENSTDYVCTPFKHILGAYVEALELGADVLVQVTGFCRLNYYGELSEMILRDMGFDFDMLNFSNTPNGKIRDYVNYCKKVVNPNLSVPHGVANLVGAWQMVEHLDAFHECYRALAGFEVEKGSFDRVEKRFMADMDAATSLPQIEDAYRRGMDALEALPVDKPVDPVRVGIVGEYYTAQDATSNLGVEKKLIEMGVELHQAMTISSRNLHYNEPALRNTVSEYCEHSMGPTSTLNIAAAKRYAEQGFDGIVHIKSAGCTPEIDVMPVLQRLSRDYRIPVLFLTFDTQTSDAGLDTRLEAFYDMISMKKAR